MTAIRTTALMVFWLLHPGPFDSVIVESEFA